MQVQKYTLTLGKVTNKGEVCKTPIIEILSTGDFSVACIDKNKGVYELEGVLPENKCIDILISCGECSDCPPKEIRRCVCDVSADCGDCEFCGPDGFCLTKCDDTEYCLNDECVQCDASVPCPDGKVCKNGRCVCPQDKIEVNGVCLDCIEDEPCRICRDGIFINKPCSGVCDPASGDCVDCLAASDCDGDNECCKDKKCECCTGFVRNQAGVCVAAPDCSQDSDCGACESCNDGKCDPILCPTGKVCINGNCVDECDCTLPIVCPDPGDYCFNNSNDCGCLDCQGDCTTGCQEGCYCNGTSCVGDICFGGKCPCENGADCPEGYGCENGQCVPCAAQSCDTLECANVLGCECANNNCIDSDVACGNTPCTTSDDCNDGCSCYEGVCKSCNNFSCAECGTVNGCSCTGNVCENSNNTCLDTFELTKSDLNCTLTATLNKNEDCACSPITVDIQTRKVSSGDSNFITLEFVGEARKGVYQGDLSLPLLDNIANEEIVENDSPTSGRITVNTTISFIEYEVDVNTNLRTRIGSGSQTPIVRQASFVTGNTASIILGQIDVPPIGFVEVTERDSQGRVIKEIKYSRVDIEAKVTDDFDFPNTCTYDSEDTIGRYRIINNSDYDAFGFAFGNHLATTLTTSDTRLPIFRWYKSNNQDVISDAPFRKLYVGLTNGSYVDTITGEEGLEACKYYKVISDCTCATSPDIFAVFCNPQDLIYEIGSCNKSITIDPVILTPCTPNLNVEYYFRAGSVYQTWLGSRWDTIAGNTYISSENITSVEYGQVCDSAGGCTKTYEEVFELDNLEISLIPTCNGGEDFTITIPSFDKDGGCRVNRVIINNTTYVPGQTVTLLPGVTAYTVYWDCGCDPSTGNITEFCCIPNQTIERNCTGPAICQNVTGNVYSVNGTVITDICTYVNGLANNQTAVIDVARNGCPSYQITIPSIEGTCCDRFVLGGNRTSGTTLSVFTPDDDNATFTLSRVDGQPFTAENPLTGTGGSVTFNNLMSSVTYRVTLTSSKGCGVISRDFANLIIIDPPVEGDEIPPTIGGGESKALGVVAGSDYNAAPPISNGCGNNTELERIKKSGNITLRAEVINQSCECPEGTISLTVDNVSEFDANTIKIDYTTQALGINDEVMSTTVIRDVSRGVNYPVSLNSSSSVNIPKITTSQPTPLGAYYLAYVISTSSSENSGELEILPPRLYFDEDQIAGKNRLGYEINPDDISQATLSIRVNRGGNVNTETFIGNRRVNGDQRWFDFGLQTAGQLGTIPTNEQFTITLDFANGDQFTNTATIFNPNNIQSTPYSERIQVDTTQNFEQELDIQLSTTNLMAEDNCNYSGVTGVVKLTSAGVVGVNNRSTSLNKLTSNGYTYFDWKTGGATVFEEYKATTSELPVANATLGNDYLLTTVCGSCQESQTLRLCKAISGAATIAACYDSITFTMSVEAGTTYNVTFDGTTQTVAATGTTLSATFTTTLLENTSYTVEFQDAAVATCVATFNLDTSTKDTGC